MARSVVIVGSGIIGLTAAHHLAAAGLRVTLLDQSEPGRGASWAGAGILPPGDPARAATPTDLLRAASTSRFSDYSARLLAETGVDNGYTRCGGVEFLTGVADDYPERWELQGIAFDRVAGSRRAYRLPDYAQVRNPRHLRALVAACHRAGCAIHSPACAGGFAFAGPEVVGVRLDSGAVLRADFVVVAAGAWAGPLLGALGVTIPVRPVRGQMVLFRTREQTGGPILLAGKRYLVPRGDGRVLAGATEEPDAGFDATTTPAGVAELAAFARELMPALRHAEVEATWAGLRPGSPDGRPTIGPVPGHPNVVLAVGHFRSGIQQSIGTAILVRNLVLGERPLLPLGPFAPERVVGPADGAAFRS